MEWAVLSHRGLTRAKNEDNLLVCSDLGLFAVADGLGGHHAGEVASRLALASLERAVRDNDHGDPLHVLTAAFEQANQDVYRAAQANPKYEKMGTTLTACIIQSDRLYWLHVGDSRGYVMRENKIKQFTEDHSYVSDFVRKGELTPKEAEAHPYRHVLTRAIGTGPLIHVDKGTVALEPEDTVLLCTDGLTVHLSDAEILSTAQQGKPAEQAERLVKMALQRGGTDNITLILIKIPGINRPAFGSA
ncbi:MAG TPA: Stp1/IreP family PP2C-type Ser/Thr phosphatase [Desulfotomaculum sp.]|nr:Stp1/IreP family PP2C-type Ser/Thr phosphatase [Desulfotomaculum sp.]